MTNKQHSNLSPFNKRKQHDLKRQAILSVAASLFNTRGPRATTLLDISSALNLTKTSLYYYVKNKEELVYECYKDSCDQFINMIEAAHLNAAKGEFLPTLLNDFIQSWYDSQHNEAPAMAILYEIQSLKSHHSEDIKSRYITIITTIRDILIEEEKSGHIRHMNALATAHAFFSTLQWATVWLHKVDIDEAKATVTDVIINGTINADMYLDEELHTFVRDTSPFDFSQDNGSTQKQEAFIKTACSYFNKKGYRATSLDEISKALNVTKGAFYHHIKNKEDLLIGCFERTFTIMTMILQKAEETGSTGLEKMFIAMLNLYAVENSDQGPLIHSGLLMALSESAREPIMERYSQLSDKIGNILRNGIEDGSIRPINAYITQELMVGTLFSGDEYQDWATIKDMRRSAADYLRFLTRGLHP